MPKNYETRVRQLATDGSRNMNNLLRLMSKQEQNTTKVFYSSRSKTAQAKVQPISPSTLIERVESDSKQGIRAVCVIENISPTFIEELGAAWKIDPQFFATHASNPDKDSLWDRQEWNPNQIMKAESEISQHLNGIFEYHKMDLSIDQMKASSNNYCDRHVFKEEPWPVNSSTMISYCRVMPTFYLFLVDPAISYEHALIKPNTSKAHTMLRFPYAGNRGGLLVPSLPLEKMCIPLEALKMLFQHQWLIDLLFGTHRPFPKVPFLYTLSSSLCETSFRILEERINDISFYEIRRPHLGITDPLHDLRAELSTLRSSIKYTLRFTPSSVKEFFKSMQEDPNVNMKRTPIEILADLLEQANQLHAFLLETFQLLMNTITVQDSQHSIRQTNESLKQTRQSMVLIVLATIYLPLSLGTGIFGMNLNEMTGSGPHVWVFAVTVVLVVLSTATVFLLPVFRRRLHNLVQPYFRKQPEQPAV